jgi:hypothetical protein
VLLAAGVAAILMSALYVAVEIQLRQAQAGRDVIQQTTLIRALTARIVGDISSSVGAVLPTPTSAPAGQGSAAAGGGGTATSGGASTASGGASTTSPTGSTGGAGSASSTGAATSASATVTTNSGVQINLGIQGDANRLMLTVSQWPRELNLAPAASSDAQPLVSDLRRITYWLVSSDSGSQGLARQEVKLVTSGDATSVIPPGIPDEPSYVIAEEVKSLTFSYFDGSTWQDSWDGTQPGADGVTPKGPPLAVAITMGVATPGAGTGPDGLKQYRHVVSILSANGATQPNTATTTSP